jgi:prophage maintenance system killer protein
VYVRAIGPLEAAIHRPRASVLGQDAYPDLLTKAAALLHSLARNHPSSSAPAATATTSGEIARALSAFT